MNLKRASDGPIAGSTIDVAFEDFPKGRVCRTQGVTVTESHVVSWAALTGDWYPLHMDEEFARKRSTFGKRVAHGPLIFALSIGLMARSGVFGDAIVAWLGCDDLRATEPVFLGDTVRLEATVSDSRRSKSDPSRGVVSLQYRTFNQHDRIVLFCIFTLMMRARSNGDMVGPTP